MKVNESFRVSYLFLELLIYFVKCSIDYVPTLFGSQNHFFLHAKFESDWEVDILKAMMMASTL